MTVRPLIPDVPPAVRPHDEPAPPAASFARALDAFGAVFSAATQAEDAYARGTGSLRDAIYERVRADVALSVAVAAAQRTAQAVQSVLSMQL